MERFFAEAGDIKLIQPAESAPWQLSLASPGWLAGVEGEAGINGKDSHIDVSARRLIPHLDMAASLRGELSKGRFGLTTDLFYVSLSDGVGSDTVVKKLDLRVDLLLNEYGMRWRLLEGPHGWLDVIGGVRYNYLYQALALQPNSERISEVSIGLVDEVSERLRTALSESGLRGLVEQQISDQLEVLRGRKPTLPTGPLAGHLPGLIRDRVTQILNERRAELAAAIRAQAQA